MTEETNNIENHSVGGSVAVGRDVTVGGRSIVRGNATFDRDVYISGWLNARNIRGAGKGLYETVEKLNSAYPNPENGWFALVGDTLPADIYRAWGGVWEATGQKGGEPVLELARLTELSESLENEVSDRVAADEALKKAIDAEADARTKAIAAEAKAREDADAAETTARTAAIEAEAQARGTAISDEATARSEADKALQTAMDKNVTELKGADTEHESRLLALEQSEWPLSLELSINPILIEFTGNEKDTTVAWKIMRKGVGVTPTELTFNQNGVALAAGLTASGSINAKVNKLGDTVFEIVVTADGMKGSTSKKLTMVLPVYCGFGTSESDVAVDENKLSPRTSASGTYSKTSKKDDVNFIILVPKTLPGLSSFTMGGAPFVMITSSVVVNGHDYYMYKSGGIYMSGTNVKVQAS
ncbi:hypothetical protein ACTQ43_07485 [Segatella copri]|uniref:hypothetical protein n=1 Tax=Segatella copri TaxID=165179 RepID=UPI003F9607C3